MTMQIKMDRIASLFSEGCEEEGEQRAYARQVARQERRRALLREAPARRLSRLSQVIWRSLQPACLAHLAPTFDLLWREKTIGAIGLPDPESALSRPDGLVGLAKDLSAANLTDAYARGLHPRCLIGPATFWAPSERLVAHPGNLRLGRRLRAALHRSELEITFDRDFEPLVAACASGNADSARLNPKLLKAHIDLFDAGIAHSFEVHDRRGRLVGGGYGMAIGRSFIVERWCGEAGDARLGLAVLARHLAHWGFRLVDATMVAHLVQGMNFAPMPRLAYVEALDQNGTGGRPGRWRHDPDIYEGRPATMAMRHLFDEPAPAKNVLPDELADLQADLFASLGNQAAPARANLRIDRAA